MYKGRPVRIIPDLSVETLKARRSGQMCCRLHEITDASPEYYIQQNFQSTVYGKNKIFHVKVKSKQYLSTNSAL